MERYVIPSLVVATWLFLWAGDIGVLVFAKQDGSYRDCYYFIGFGVQKHFERDASRCRLLSRV